MEKDAKKTISSRIAGYTAIFITVIILATFVSFYLWYFVSQNEAEINNRQFRTLERIAYNMNMRIPDFDKLANNKIRDAENNIFNKNRKQNTVNLKKELSNNKNVKSKVDNRTKIEFSNDSLSFIQELKITSSVIFNWIVIISSKDTATLPVAKTIYRASKEDSVFVIEKENDTHIMFRKKSSLFENSYVCMGIQISKYLPKLLKHDFFTNYTFIKDKRIIYSDFSQRLDASKIKHLLDTVSAFNARSIRKLEFSGEHFTLYTIPFSIFGQDIYMLSGAVLTKKITNEKLSVPDSFVFALLFLLLSIAIAFPFLKVFLMSPYEKLNTSDILLSLLSITFATGLFFYILLSQFQNHKVDVKANEKLQKELTKNIKKSFIEDIVLAHRQLKVFDNHLNQVKQDVIYLNNDDSLQKIDLYGNKIALERNQVGAVFYTYFKSTFWLDSKGKEIYNWVNDNTLPAKYNYYDRKYFTNVTQAATWQLPDHPQESFSMQPIRSWTDGEFRTVIAMPSINRDSVYSTKQDVKHLVAVISSRLPSVIASVLPYGYKFCIIDVNGEVWFHSDKNRCQNENLLDECNQNSELISALYARSSVSFSQRYAGAACNMYLEPIDKLPLYIITINDTAPVTVKNIEIFIITLFFLVLLLIFVSIQMGLLLLINGRSSQLKNNDMRLDWLWPDYRKTENYKGHLIINSLLVLLTILFTFYIPVTQNPGFTFYLIVFNSFISLSLYFFISHRTYFLALRPSANNKGFAAYVALCSVAMCVLACISFSGIVIFLALLYQAIILCAIYFQFQDHFSKSKTLDKLSQPLMDDQIEKTSHVKWFSRMLLSWICLMAFLPVFKFYVLAYNVETEIVTRQHQLSWVKEINKYTNLGTEFTESKFKLLSDTRLPSNIYTEPSLYPTSICKNLAVFDTSKVNQDAERKFICKLNSWMRFVFNETSSKENSISQFNEQDSTSFQWKLSNNNTLQLKAFDGVNSIKNDGDTLVVSTVMPLYSLPNLWNDSDKKMPLLFWITLLLSFFVLLKAIKFFIKKLFLPNYFKTTYNDQMSYINKLSHNKKDEKVAFPKSGQVQINQESLNEEKEKNQYKELRLMLVSLPHSGKNAYFREEANFKHFSKIVIDFALIRNKTEWDNELEKLTAVKETDLVICLHFEYYLSDPAVNNAKLESIDFILKKKIRNIILISTIHPANFLNSVATTKTQIGTLPTDISHLIEDNLYYIWSNLMSSFEVVYYPLQVAKAVPEKSFITAEVLIDRECNHGLFLQNLKKSTEIYSGSLNERLSYEDFEDIILKIQSLSYNYYLSLWNTLTKEEQYVLYDLAEDGLVNYKNFESLSQLHYKGLIINRGRPEVMNRSFRNFILTEVKNGSPILSNTERSKDSAWKRFKTPFYLVLLVVLFFVFYTQQDSFNTLTTVLGSFTAALPIILRLFSTLNVVKSGTA